jgi:FG-GAP-like repeat
MTVKAMESNQARMFCILIIATVVTATSAAQYNQPIFNGPPTTTYGWSGRTLVADLDNSGLPDLVAGGALLLDPAVNGIQAPSSVLPAPYCPRTRKANIDGDANVDIVGVSYGQTFLYLGQGGGTLSVQPLPLGLPATASVYEIHAADLDGDGRDDVVVLAGDLTATTDTLTYHAFLNNHPQWTQSWSFPLTYNINFESLANDFNGDGKPDLCWRYTPSAWGTYAPTPLSIHDQFWVAFGDGVGGFLPPSGYPMGLQPNPLGGGYPGVWALDTNDLDGDGRSDVVLVTGYGPPNLRFLYGDALLGLQPFVSGTWPTNLGPFQGGQTGGVWHFFSYDIDVDGDIDLVRIGSFGAIQIPTYPGWSFGMTVEVLNSTGYRTFANLNRQDIVVPAPTGSWYTPADFDRDGDVDLIAVPNLLDVSVYLDNTALFGSGCTGAGGARPISIQGDFTLGNAGYFVGLQGAAPSSPAAFAVALNKTPSASCGIYLDLSLLLLPIPSFGFTTTDASGNALLGLPLPGGTFLAGTTVFSQWFVADPAGALSAGGNTYATSRGRTLVLW